MLAATISLIYQKCDKKRVFQHLSIPPAPQKTPPAMFLSPSKNIYCVF